MNEHAEQRVHVERKRERCPYCHDEIVAGEVWICPGCEAAQHSACRDENKGCAACEWSAAEGVEKGAVAELPTVLATRRDELLRQGFEILHADSERITALKARWHWDCVMTKLVYTVFVRRLPRLSEEAYLADQVKLKEETERLDASKLPRGFQKGNATIVLYVADEVEPEVVKRIEEKPERGFARLFFPISLETSSGKGAYLQTIPAWGALYYPKFRHLAERLLHPEAPITSEPLSRRGAAITLLGLFSLILSIVLLLAT